MLGGAGAAVGCWDRDGGSGPSSQSKGTSMSRAPLRARCRSVLGTRDCGGDTEPGDELRDRPVVPVGDVVLADGGQRRVGGDPVADLLPGLPAQFLDRVVGVLVDG